MPADSKVSNADREDALEPLLVAVLPEIDSREEEVAVENEVASFEEESSLFISVIVADVSRDGCRAGGDLRSKLGYVESRA